MAVRSQGSCGSLILIMYKYIYMYMYMYMYCTLYVHVHVHAYVYIHVLHGGTFPTNSLHIFRRLPSNLKVCLRNISCISHKLTETVAQCKLFPRNVQCCQSAKIVCLIIWHYADSSSVSAELHWWLNTA